MEKIREILDWVENNSKEIIDNIEQESIDVYNFLKNEFERSNVNENYLFQFVYRSFYRIDNAGLTTEFKKEYFKILEEIRNVNQFDYGEILTRLYSFPNIRGYKTMQFSFVTKMFNTINSSLPIYDSAVAKIFSLSRPYHSDFEIKMDKYLNQLDIIAINYQQIIEKNLLPNATILFDETFVQNNLSDMKKLDFIFWSAGKMKTRLTKKGDNGFHTLDELDEVDHKIKMKTQHQL